MKIKILDPDADDAGIRITAKMLEEDSDGPEAAPFEFWRNEPTTLTLTEATIIPHGRARPRSEYRAAKVGGAVGVVFAAVFFAVAVYSMMAAARMALALIRHILAGLGADTGKPTFSKHGGEE